MDVNHIYEGQKYPFREVIVKKKTETSYSNTITYLNYSDGYSKSVIGIWHIKWKSLHRYTRCDDQKKNWIKAKSKPIS